MSISIEDKIFDNALKYARDEAYYDALRLFCRVDSYESEINQIGCLCCMRDVFFAADAYRRLKCKYFATHNCYHDVSLLGAVGKSLLKYAEAKNVRIAETHGEKDKISADFSKIAPYEHIIDNDYDADDFYELADVVFDEDYAPDGIFDAKSTEYFDYLHDRLRKSLLLGRKKEAEKLAKAYLELDTDDIYTLEMQLTLCSHYQKNALGAKFAVRYANSQDDSERSPMGISCAVELLTHKKTERESLAKLLRFALETDGFPPYDLDDFITIAANVLRDEELSYLFAKKQYAQRREIGLEYIKKCIYAFYNYGDFKAARDAAVELYQAVPNDAYANVILDYVSMQGNSRLSIPEIGAYAYALPRSIIVRYQIRFAEKLEKGDYTLTDSDLVKLSAMITNCKALYMSGNKENYILTATFVRTVLEQCKAQNAAAYERFARTELSSVSPDCLILDAVLLTLIKSDCKDTVLISYGDNSYYLDLSKVTVRDEGFLSALSLCAVIQKINVERLQKAYLCVVSATKTAYNNAQDGRKLAYCLFALTDKNFATSVYADLFFPDEKQFAESVLSGRLHIPFLT